MGIELPRSCSVSKRNFIYLNVPPPHLTAFTFALLPYCYNNRPPFNFALHILSPIPLPSQNLNYSVKQPHLIYDPYFHLPFFNLC